MLCGKHQRSYCLGEHGPQAVPREMCCSATGRVWRRYDLHVLLVEHGKRCSRCAKNGKPRKESHGDCPLVNLQGSAPAKDLLDEDIVKEEAKDMEEGDIVKQEVDVKEEDTS